MTSQINKLINDIATQLYPIYSTSAEQYAWWLISAVTMQSQHTLLTQHTITLSSQQQTKLTQFLDQIINQHMPFAYVVGTIPFGDLEIIVKPPILIPRPETEEWCLQLAHQLQKVRGPLTILDLCTGSGCIALALAHALPSSQIYGVDINTEALELAHENAEHNKISNVTWIQSDLFSQLPTTLKFDLVVSNPPYISESEWQTLEKSVKNWEDTRALIAPQEGLAILNAIIQQTPPWLTHNPQLEQLNCAQLMVEIGYNQAVLVHDLFEHAGYKAITVTKDLAGHNRTVSGRVDHVAIFKKSG